MCPSDVLNQGSNPELRRKAKSECVSLSRSISRFVRSLTPVDKLDKQIVSLDGRRALLLVHSLSHGAMIYLHDAQSMSTLGFEVGSTNASLFQANEILCILEYIVNYSDYAGLLDPTIVVSSEIRAFDLYLSITERLEACIKRILTTSAVDLTTVALSENLFSFGRLESKRQTFSDRAWEIIR